MEGVGYVAAWLLALVFASAGWAKARRRVETVEAFAGLGLPAPDRLAVVVPGVEIGLAAALVLVPGVAAALALALLAGFTVVLARSLRSGQQVGCGCFGAVGAQPVSFVELVRNAMLAALAVAALATPAPVVPALEDVIVVVGAAATGLVVLALCELYRETGTVFANEPKLESRG